MQNKHTSIAFTLTAAISIAILYGTLTPSPTQPDPSSNDKIAHFMAFATFVFPLTYARAYPAVIMLVAGIVFGGLIEVIQPYFGRSKDIMDWIADAAGVLGGISLALALNKLRTPKSGRPD